MNPRVILLLLITAAVPAGLVQGMAGFGCMILLMIFFPYILGSITVSVAVASVTSISISVLLLTKYGRNINFKEALLPILLYVPVSFFFAKLSGSMNQHLMKRILGAFLLLLGLYYLFLAKGRRRTLCVPAKLACIVFSAVSDGLFGIGGPLMVVYFMALIDEFDEYIATIQLFFITDLTFLTIYRAYLGILKVQFIPYILAGVAGICIGYAAAVKLRKHIRVENMKKITYGVIALAGLINMLV